MIPTPRSATGWALDRLLDRWGPRDDAERADRLARRLGRARELRGYSARDLSGAPFEALARQPLLSRRDLATDLERYVDPRWPAALLWTAQSSGSAGQPLRIRRDPFGAALEEAFLRRQLRSFGWSEGWPSLVVRAGGPRDPGGPVFDRDRVRGELRVAASRLDGVAVTAIVERLHSARIQLIRGYPSALLEIARRAQLSGLGERLRSAPVRLLHVSSETLDEPDEALLHQAFGAEVADHYGQAERALLIQSCQRGARHLIDDYAIGESIDGRWVGTPLHGCGILLRYDTGDLCGVVPPGARSCGCGSPFPVVGRVQGRQDDVVVTSDGRRIGRLGPALRAVEDAEQIQVEQGPAGALTVRVLPGPKAGSALATQVEGALRELLRDDRLSIEVRVGEEPVRGPGGKLRAVIRRDGLDQER